MRKMQLKRLTVDILYDIAGSIFFAAGIYTFARMADFAPGGMSGLALILNHLCGIPIGITTLLLNIPFVLISYRVLGKEFLLKSTRTIIISTLFLDVVFPHIPVYTGSPFLAALYSGICCGVGLTMFYMRGSSSGGTDFLIMTVKALRPHLSIGAVTMGSDLIIIVLGWPVFGNVDAVLYGLASTAVTSMVIDKIMYGVGAGTLAVIITKKGKEVADAIGAITGRGSTVLKGKGTYTMEEKEVLLCACSNAQSYVMKRTIHEIDPGAFIMLTETSQVFGEGFIQSDR